jgi:hypothetical protein
VVRSYDSRDPRQGDFGQAWQLSLSDVRIEKSAVLGKFWGRRPWSTCNHEEES